MPRLSCSVSCRTVMVGLLAAALAACGLPVESHAGGMAFFASSLPEVLSPNARWATGVVAYSSQYGADNWAATHALGYPDTWPAYGDRYNAWASLTPDGQREFIELSYDDPAPANYLVAVETYNPGAIDSVYTWNPDSSRYDLVWSGAVSPSPGQSRLFVVMFPTTPYPVSRIRLALDSPAVSSWNEIDAVAIGANGFTSRQWATSAVASSQYGPVYYSPSRATGPPDVYPNHSDDVDAWASLNPDGGREWIQLGYSEPCPIARVGVYQTFHPGAIDSIYVRDALDGTLQLVYSAIPAAQPPVASILTALFPQTSFPVDAVRITLASDQVPGWNEIDAVLIADSTDVVLPGITAVPGAAAGATAISFASPNPARGTMNIGFTLERPGRAELEVFDVRGARIASLAVGEFSAGTHTATWRGRDASGHRVASGAYLLRLEVNGARSMRRVVLVE